MSSDNSSGGSAGSSIVLGMYLFPIYIAGVYAFIKKATVLAAIESVIGVGPLALAITNALWVVGAAATLFLGVILLITAFNCVLAVVQRSLLNLIVAISGTIYAAIGVVGALTLFSDVPLLIGFFLSTGLAIYLVLPILLLVAGGVFSVLLGTDKSLK